MKHVTLVAGGRLVLFTTRAECLAAVRAIARACGLRLVLFCVVDDHVHLVFADDDVGQCANGLRRTLAPLAAVPFEVPHISPVKDRRHLETLVDYLLTQSSHHGLDGPPALWPGSCLPDLIGARLLPGFDAGRLARELPRRGQTIAWEAVGLRPAGPASDAALADAGPARIARAAARAVGHEDPHEAGQEARSTAAGLLSRLGYNGRQISEALSVPQRSARRLRLAEPSPLEHCVRMQISLENEVIRTALRSWKPPRRNSR